MLIDLYEIARIERKYGLKKKLRKRLQLEKICLTWNYKRIVKNIKKNKSFIKKIQYIEFII